MLLYLFIFYVFLCAVSVFSPAERDFCYFIVFIHYIVYFNIVYYVVLCAVSVFSPAERDFATSASLLRRIPFIFVIFVYVFLYFRLPCFLDSNIRFFLGGHHLVAICLFSLVVRCFFATRSLQW